MADEYYDFDHEFNFRDRDILVAGDAVRQASSSFEAFWNSELSVPVEDVIDSPFDTRVQETYEDELGDEQAHDEAYLDVLRRLERDTGVAAMFDFLRRYEDNRENYDDEMRGKIRDNDAYFHTIIEDLHWVDADYISDMPGKNDSRFTLGGGGHATAALVEAIESAQQRITIQTPYLVTTLQAWLLLREAIQRGVEVRISTNSLSSTDNLPAYSGYSRQRNRLLNTGIDIFEFRPDAKVLRDIVTRFEDFAHAPPVFSMHAKSLVVDGRTGFVGSFNLDPRSENLNTEAFIRFEDERLATLLEQIIEVDMRSENSWHVRRDGHGREASLLKKTGVFLLELIPMDGIL